MLEIRVLALASASMRVACFCTLREVRSPVLASAAPARVSSGQAGPQEVGQSAGDLVAVEQPRRGRRQIGIELGAEDEVWRQQDRLQGQGHARSKVSPLPRASVTSAVSFAISTSVTGRRHARRTNGRKTVVAHGTSPIATGSQVMSCARRALPAATAAFATDSAGSLQLFEQQGTGRQHVGVVVEIAAAGVEGKGRGGRTGRVPEQVAERVVIFHSIEPVQGHPPRIDAGGSAKSDRPRTSAAARRHGTGAGANAARSSAHAATRLGDPPPEPAPVPLTAPSGRPPGLLTEPVQPATAASMAIAAVVAIGTTPRPCPRADCRASVVETMVAPCRAGCACTGRRAAASPTF